MSNLGGRPPKLIIHEGVSKTRSEWATSLGISIGTLDQRLKRWPIDQALSLPKLAHHPRSADERAQILQG